MIDVREILDRIMKDRFVYGARESFIALQADYDRLLSIKFLPALAIRLLGLRHDQKRQVLMDLLRAHGTWFPSKVYRRNRKFYAVIEAPEVGTIRVLLTMAETL